MWALPLRFETNQGQWKPDVRYAARAGGFTLQLLARGARMTNGQGHKLEIALPGSKAAAIEGLEPMAARTDYMIGDRSQWHLGVSNYSKVRYKGVYPGVDLVYYGNQDQLEYDFVLQPGADPSAIRLQFKGSRRLSVNADGDLQVDVATGQLVEKRPVVYQEDGRGRHLLEARYKLLGASMAGIEVSGWDKTRKLVIDPVLTYCSYVGGTAHDQVIGTKMVNGKLYVVGMTDNNDLGYIDGAYKNTINGSYDVFLGILDPANNYKSVYFGYVGGSGSDYPQAMDVDSSGNFYFAGYTGSTDYPRSSNAYQETGTSSYKQAFVTKLNPAIYGGDSLLYSTFLGGDTGDNWGRGLALASDGTIWVIGTTRADNFPRTANVFQDVLWNDQDAFISHLDPSNGTLLFSTLVGGSGYEDGRAIAVDAKGNVVFALETNADYLFTTVGSYETSRRGGTEIAVGLLDPTKSNDAQMKFMTLLGGTLDDEVEGLALGPDGQVAVTGYTMSLDYPVTANALRRSRAGNSDAFVTVINPYDPYPLLRYSTFLGGKSGDAGYRVKYDSDGHLWATGYTLSTGFPVTSDAYQKTWGAGADVYVTELDPTASGAESLLYSSFFGKAGTHVPLGIDITSDSVYVCGYSSDGMPTTDGTRQWGFSGGGTDGFFLVLSRQ
jgi:hypothetical protein